MDKELNLKKKVFNRQRFSQLINTEFTELVQPEEIDTDTVEEFFRLYNKLYFEIPKTGERSSHEFLIKESSKIVDVEKDTTQIQPLLDEIAQLRRSLLQKDREILEIQNNSLPL